jgi:hypothetical protein
MVVIPFTRPYILGFNAETPDAASVIRGQRRTHLPA